MSMSMIDNVGYNLVQEELPTILNIEEKYFSEDKLQMNDEKVTAVREAVLSSLAESPFISERFVDSRVAGAVYKAFEGNSKVEVAFASTLKVHEYPETRAGHGILIIQFAEDGRDSE